MWAIVKVCIENIKSSSILMYYVFIFLYLIIHFITGRPPLAVITHADVAKEQQLRNTTTHLHSIGVGEDSVFQVGNVSSSGKLKSSYKLERVQWKPRP